jgi:hypothetical protein
MPMLRLIPKAEHEATCTQRQVEVAGLKPLAEGSRSGGE